MKYIAHHEKFNFIDITYMNVVILPLREKAVSWSDREAKTVGVRKGGPKTRNEWSVVAKVFDLA